MNVPSISFKAIINGVHLQIVRGHLMSHQSTLKQIFTEGKQLYFVLIDEIKPDVRRSKGIFCFNDGASGKFARIYFLLQG